MNFYGSSQVGYIILDSATGAGAYKIGGGENGGNLYDAMVGLIELMGVISINNALSFLGKARFIPLLVSGPIGWMLALVIGVVVTFLAIGVL